MVTALRSSRSHRHCRAPRSADGGKRCCSAPDAPSLLLPSELLAALSLGPGSASGPGPAAGRVLACSPRPPSNRCLSEVVGDAEGRCFPLTLVAGSLALNGAPPCGSFSWPGVSFSRRVPAWLSQGCRGA